MKWGDLSIKDKAAFMNIAVRNGITDMDSIRDTYESMGSNNIAANGGGIQVITNQQEEPKLILLSQRIAENRKRRANRFDYGGPAGIAGDVWNDYLSRNKDYTDIARITQPSILHNGVTRSELEGGGAPLNSDSSIFDNVEGANGINLSGLSAGKEINFSKGFGQATQNLGNKLNEKASSLLGGNASGLVNAGLGAVGNIANQGFSKLFSNGLSSGAGNAIGSIGGTVGSLVGAVNPVLGAGISAATGILGGITNAAFGSKLNQEHIAAVENLNTALNNTKISSNDTTSALNDISNINWGADFTKSDIGRDGWFANKAQKKYNELSDAQSLARGRAMSASDTAVSNIAMNQRRNAMANFSAYGGPVNKYSLGSQIKQANIDYINAFGRPEWIPPVLPFAQQQEEAPQTTQEVQQQMQPSEDWKWFVDNIINGNLARNYGIDNSDWKDRMLHSFDGTAVNYRTSFNNLMSNNASVVNDIYNTLISRGFSSAQASGILGNIMVESGFRDINANDPTKKNPNNMARGYYQMGDLETNNFNKWKQRTKLAADTPAHIAQTMYVADMLNSGGYDYLGYVPGHEKTTKEQARNWFNSTNPMDAATGFMLRYEKPGKPNENLRRAYAQSFYDYFGNQSKYGGRINKYGNGGDKDGVKTPYSSSSLDTLPEVTVTAKKKKAYGGNLFDNGGFQGIDPVTAKENYQQTGNPNESYEPVDLNNIHINENGTFTDLNTGRKGNSFVLQEPTVIGKRGVGLSVPKIDVTNFSDKSLQDIREAFANEKYNLYQDPREVHQYRSDFHPENAENLLRWIPYFGSPLLAHDAYLDFQNGNYGDMIFNGLGAAAPFMFKFPAVSKIAKDLAVNFLLPARNLSNPYLRYGLNAANLANLSTGYLDDKLINTLNSNLGVVSNASSLVGLLTALAGAISKRPQFVENGLSFSRYSEPFANTSSGQSFFKNLFNNDKGEAVGSMIGHGVEQTQTPVRKSTRKVLKGMSIPIKYTDKYSKFFGRLAGAAGNTIDLYDSLKDLD